MAKCDDSVDGGGRAMSGTIAEAQNAVNTGNIDKCCNEAVGADFKKVNSWMTVMTCSEAPWYSGFLG
jgi:hypothetical protein